MMNGTPQKVHRKESAGRWRGGTPPQAPTWSYDKEDLRAYNKYVRKVEIWLLQVAPYMTRKEAALQLYGALAGEPEAALEHCPITDIYQDDGVERILEALKAPMEQKQVYQKRKFLHEFENIRRNHGETMRAYCNRFRRTQRALKSVGIEISYTYDHEALGARLLDRSGLSHEQQRLLLVSTSQNLAFDQLAEAMALQFPDFRGAPPIVGAKLMAVKFPKGTPKVVNPILAKTLHRRRALRPGLLQVLHTLARDIQRRHTWLRLKHQPHLRTAMITSTPLTRMMNHQTKKMTKSQTIASMTLKLNLWTCQSWHKF